MKKRFFVLITLLLLLTGCIPMVGALNPAGLLPQDKTEPNNTNTKGAQLSGINNTNGQMTIYFGAAPPKIDPDVPRQEGRPPKPPGDQAVQAAIKRDEGLRLKPYQDQGGAFHIGYGRNLTDKGISRGEAESLFTNDFIESVTDLESIFPGWERIPDGIRHVLVNMRYQLGPERFRGFGRMIIAARVQDWANMAAEMKDSLWYEQTPVRARALVRQVDAYIKNEPQTKE